MKRLSLMAALGTALILPQTGEAAPIPSVGLPADGAVLPAPSARLAVPPETPIRLMVMNEVSTKIAHAGDRFPLRVDQNVVVNGVAVIPVGARAWGEVTAAEKNGAAGKSGKLNAKLLYVEIGNDHIPLTGDNRAAGTGVPAQTVIGLYLWGPFGLLVRGNNAKLKAGDILVGYLATATSFDPSTRTFVAEK